MTKRGILVALSSLAAVMAGPVSPASAQSSGVVFGALVSTRGSETFPAAQARADATYGGLPISRIFYSKAPQPWPGNAGYSGRPVVVSFKYTPTAVISGTYDAALRNWFSAAPSYDVYWSYIHEPEDNISRGEFTAADYRAAWQHISNIATTSAPLAANLHSTLILMCYTQNPASGRNWLDYYAPKAQAMIAYDCYNHAGKTNRYGSPANIFKPLTDWSAANPTIPWGVSEVGSTLSKYDTDGSQRAAWLRSVGTFMANQHAANPTTKALFCLYFDVVGPAGSNYALNDANSQAAWSDVIHNY